MADTIKYVIVNGSDFRDSLLKDFEDSLGVSVEDLSFEIHLLDNGKLCVRSEN